MRVCKVRQMSPKTTSERQRVLTKLHGFAIDQGHAHLSRLLIESFLAQIAQAGGLRPVSVGSYFRILRTFCNWLVEEEYVEASPMAKIKPPVARPDQVEPLSSTQIQQLLAGAKKSEYPLRNTAILSLILDTGLRASEVCGIKFRDLDRESWSLRVLGKGNKSRMVYAGSRAAQKALTDYLRLDDRQDDDTLFLSERGPNGGGAPLTPHGLFQIVRRCGELGGVPKVGPHDLRHTFAFRFIQGGGSEFTLQTMLGHTSLTMTRKYVNLAGADLSAQARAVGTLDAALRQKEHATRKPHSRSL
jgi:site-specific recombinase XerD